MSGEISIAIAETAEDSNENYTFLPFVKVDEGMMILNGHPIFQDITQLNDVDDSILYIPVTDDMSTNSDIADITFQETSDLENFLNEHNYHHNVPDISNDSTLDLGYTFYMQNKNSYHKCSFCDKSFTTLGALRRHLRSHTGERPYQCEVCEKKFSQQSNLWKHIRIHTGERPFECPHCRRKFSQRANMQKHLVVHSGEKPFQCPSCDRSFTQQANLSKHMRLHTGDRPFQCKYCSKKFSQRSNMLKHQNLHEGVKPYTCHICFVAFTQQSNLKKHVQLHNNEKPFVCGACNKGYVQKVSLIKHMEQCSSLMETVETIFDVSSPKLIQVLSENDEPRNFYITENRELIKMEPSVSLEEES